MFPYLVDNRNHNSPGFEMVSIQRNMGGFWSDINQCTNDAFIIRMQLNTLKSQNPQLQYRAINSNGSIVDFV